MERMELSKAEYLSGEIAEGIKICTDKLQEAADYAFSLPDLKIGTYFFRMVGDQPDHRLIIGNPKTLLVERPYMVGFYGIRLPDPNGALTEKLVSVDNRLIDTFDEYQVGFYNSANWQGEYVNTAIFRDKSTCKAWGAENALHLSAVERLTPRCYQQVLKFTGYVEGWHSHCRIDLDEVLLFS